MEVLDKSKFDKGSSPYQDINALISLRNALIHYKPKTLSSSSFEPLEEHEFEKIFKRKFEPNKLMSKSGNPYFPDKCLGYGCSEWAVRKSIEFADEFYMRLGIDPIYSPCIRQIVDKRK